MWQKQEVITAVCTTPALLPPNAPPTKPTDPATQAPTQRPADSLLVVTAVGTLGGHGTGHDVVIFVESVEGDLVQPDDGLVGVLDEHVLLVSRTLLTAVGGHAPDEVDDGADDAPSVAQTQVHLARELPGFVAHDAQDDVVRGRLGVDARHEAELHLVGLCEDGLRRPPRELARVVLHLGRHDGAALRRQLGAPVERAAGALGLVVELVERLDDEELVVPGDVVLGRGVEFRPDDQVEGFLVALERQVEPAVLVRLGRQGVGLVAGAIEWVGVGEFDLVVWVFEHRLEGEVVVDHGGFHGEVAGGVDAVGLDTRLRRRGLRFQRCIGGVLVDRDQVDAAVGSLVEEDLIAVLEHYNVPGIHRASGTHEHGQDVRGCKDGGFVFLGQFLNDRVCGGCHIVGSTIEGHEFALGVLHRWLVKRAVVVVQETVAFDIVAVAGFEVEFGKSVEVDLFLHHPVWADVDRCISVSLWLVIISPAEAAATSASSTSVVVVLSLLLPSCPALSYSLECASSTSLGGSSLTTTTEDRQTASAKATALVCRSCVVDHGEG